MFQPSLTRDDFDTDSAMGVSIFTDDKSVCTFSGDEEVSEVAYTYIVAPVTTCSAYAIVRSLQSYSHYICLEFAQEGRPVCYG